MHNLKTYTQALLEMSSSSHDALLLISSETGDVKSMEAHLRNGADPNIKDYMQRAPLHHAAFIGESDAVDLLIENGADVNAVDREGFTPLMYTMFNNHEKSAASLLNAGADPNTLNDKGVAAISIAKFYNSKDCMKLLIQAGANPVHTFDSPKEVEEYFRTDVDWISPEMIDAWNRRFKAHRAFGV